MFYLRKLKENFKKLKKNSGKNKFEQTKIEET